MNDTMRDFIAKAGWGDAAVTPLAADFSPRRYFRLRRAAIPSTAILLSADETQKTPQFVALAHVLRNAGVNAPQIYAENAAQGLALLEDFGDTTFGQLLDAGADPAPLYRRAVDLLVTLHKNFRREMVQGINLPLFNAELFAAQAGLLLDTYVPHVTGRVATDKMRAGFSALWLDLLAPLQQMPQTLILRDYMPDNLMDVNGITGVLDFQDGGIGPMAYDLVSLCETVRRDGGDVQLASMIDYYHTQNPFMPLVELHAVCRVLSAQRHVRVLGILASKPEKHVYIPRVRKTLDALLHAAELQSLRQWFDENGVR